MLIDACSHSLVLVDANACDEHTLVVLSRENWEFGLGTRIIRICTCCKAGVGVGFASPFHCGKQKEEWTYYELLYYEMRVG
jgi:hypothetical protein